MTWGVTVAWSLALSAALGLWLMLAPAVLGTRGAAAGSDRVAGALIVTVSIIAMAEVVRAGRLLNVLLGLWTFAAPWLLAGAPATARWSNAAAGLLLVALSLPRGSVRERYAGWDDWIV